MSAVSFKCGVLVFMALSLLFAEIKQLDASAISLDNIKGQGLEEDAAASRNTKENSRNISEMISTNFSLETNSHGNEDYNISDVNSKMIGVNKSTDGINEDYKANSSVDANYNHYDEEYDYHYDYPDGYDYHHDDPDNYDYSNYTDTDYGYNYNENYTDHDDESIDDTYYYYDDNYDDESIDDTYNYYDDDYDDEGDMNNTTISSVMENYTEPTTNISNDGMVYMFLSINATRNQSGTILDSPDAYPFSDIDNNDQQLSHFELIDLNDDLNDIENEVNATGTQSDILSDIVPVFSNDSHIYKGESTVFLSIKDLEKLSESKNQTNLNDTEINNYENYDDDYDYDDYNDYDDDDDDDDDEDDDYSTIIEDMTDAELENFLEKFKDDIETVDEEFEATTSTQNETLSANDTDNEMTDEIRLTPDITNDKEISCRDETECHIGTTPTLNDEVKMELKKTEPLIIKETDNQEEVVDFAKTYDKLYESDLLSRADKNLLANLERIRRSLEDIGKIENIHAKNPRVHHIVKRQLGTETCGSFSKRKRRDISAENHSKSFEEVTSKPIHYLTAETFFKTREIAMDVNSERHKRGISNIGRRLESGNPGFRQLFNQYKHMCNFIAMVAFEK